MSIHLIQVKRTTSLVSPVPPMLAGELAARVDPSQGYLYLGLSDTTSIRIGSGTPSYVHVQVVPSTTWTVIHNFGFRPIVQLRDSAGAVMGGQIQHDSGIQCTVTFNSPTVGEAHCQGDFSGNFTPSYPPLTDGDKGDVTVTASGTLWVVDPNTIVNTKLADMATKTYKGRTSVGTGDPEDVPVATLKADLLLTASDIVNVPAGNIAAINVQLALDELDAEKMTANAPIVGATNTKITYDTQGLVVSGTAATTADINDSLNRRYVTDLDLVDIGNLSGVNTGDQTITLTSDVTGTGTGSFATTIAAGVVSNTKLADVSTATFKGRTTAGTGSPEDLTVAQAKTLLNLSGINTGDQNLTDYFNKTVDDTDDITVGATNLFNQTHTGDVTGAVALTIANDAVTLAKMANVATGTVFYRTTAGAGDPEVQPLATLKTDLGITGTNGGDQNLFSSIAVAAQPTVTASSLTTALTLIAGTNITITTDNTTKEITVNAAGGGSGSVTSVSVVSTNGFAGTVATPSTTPAITISSSVVGLLLGNGTAVSAAVAGTDFVAPNAAITGATNTKITYDAKGLVTVGASAVLASADYVNQGTTTTVLHGNAAGNPSWGAVSLTTDVSGTLPVLNGGTGQTSYVNGELLIGNTAGNTLTKATLIEGAGIKVTNGAGSITIASAITFNLAASHQGNTTASLFLDKDATVPTNLSPFVVPFACTLLYMTAKSNPAGVGGSWTAEIYKNGVSFQTLAVTANKAVSGLLSVAFAAGDEVSMYVTHPGTNFRDPSINAFFRQVL